MAKGGRKIKSINRLDDVTQKDIQIADRKNGAAEPKSCVDTLVTFGQNKKAAIASGLRKSLILMVTEAEIEPARRERRGILNQRASLESHCMK
ncbi:hypothetical protein HQ400_04025 [Aeromonas jandaei]|nr:hypothetical protein HQ400_04025 [Aeromonas jandaei]